MMRPGREGADEPRHPNLPEIGVDLDLGEDGAVRIEGVGGCHRRIARRLRGTDHLVAPGAPEDFGIAFAATLVIAAMQSAGARDDADVAGAEER